MSGLVVKDEGIFPALSQFWQKVGDDLKSGYRIKGNYPNYRDVIRVWARHGDEYQFLLIATATQGLSVPVSSLEMLIYGQNRKSWRLSMLQHPFPEPHWRHEWQTLKAMYPVEVPDLLTKQWLINLYLQASVDNDNTKKTYEETLGNMGPERLSWVGDV